MPDRAPVRLVRAEHDDPRVLDAVRAYVTELDARFPGGFGVDDVDLVDPGGHYLLAMGGDAGGGDVTLGVGGVRPLALPDGVPTGEVKRMWVSPDARGSGLGRLLLHALEDLARDLGHRRVVLDTHLALGEAVGMYDRAGYERVARYNENPYAQAFFSKAL